MTGTTTEDVERLAQLHDRRARNSDTALTIRLSSTVERATRASLSEARETAATLRALAAERDAMLSDPKDTVWSLHPISQALVGHLEMVTAQRDVLAARCEQMEAALREINRIVPNHPAGVIASVALKEDSHE